MCWPVSQTRSNSDNELQNDIYLLAARQIIVIRYSDNSKAILVIAILPYVLFFFLFKILRLFFNIWFSLSPLGVRIDDEYELRANFFFFNEAKWTFCQSQIV
jgi:hypothetical protein